MDSIGTTLWMWLFLDLPAAFVNHLWQSTLFALVAGAVALLLRRNAARVRYALWLAASLKFLVPFAMLAALGAQVSWEPQATATPPTQLIAAAREFTAPMEPVADQWELLPGSMQPERSRNLYLALVPALALLWAAGALFVALRWSRQWLVLRRVLRQSRPGAGVDFPAPVRITEQAMEPGIVGVLRPVLLLPAGMEERLAPEQMRAVLAHELCHLRRRDNLTATLHMLVEAVFWFHPLVWWIGARLIDERERACDEQVVREGHAPRTYAEAILGVCEHYIASRLPCVSGVSGSDLRQRVESIVGGALIARLTPPRKAVIATLACAAVATPIAAGIATWRSQQARSHYLAAMLQYHEVLDLDRGATPLCAPRNRSMTGRQARLASNVAKLEAGDGSRVLLLAVLASSAPDVQRLLAAGAPMIDDGFVLGGLMNVAAEFGSPAILQALHETGLDLDASSAGLGSVDPEASYARTPLMTAIAAGRRDNVEWLLAQGADANVDRGAISALSLAMSSCKDQQLVTRLVDAGAVPTERDRRIATNLQFDLTASGIQAPRSGATLSALANEVPATSAARQSTRETVAGLAATLKAEHLRAGPSCQGRGAGIREAQNALRGATGRLSARDGADVLLHAVMADSAQDVQRLLAEGAPRSNPREILAAAARYADPPVLQALLDAGIARGRDAGAMLPDAAFSGRTSNVVWLLEHDAEIQTSVGARDMALQHAMACRSQVLANVLLGAGARITDAVRNSADWFGVDLSTNPAALGRGTLDPPRGWQFPDIAQLAADPVRADSPSLFTEVREDFDGDGEEDRAALFVNAQGAEAVFAKLSSRKARGWTQAAEFATQRTGAPIMGITIARAGTYATACAKGYGRSCQPDEPRAITLAQPGISFFALESGGGIIWWDGSGLQSLYTSD